jgi:hypothetical protein
MAILLTLIVSLLAGAASFALTGQRQLPEELLRYLLLISNALILFASAMSHLFRQEVMANALGWAVGGPFQRVAGFWNMGAAIVCVLAFIYGGAMTTAAVVITAIFWAGAASLHWQDAAVSRDKLLTASGETLLAALLPVLALLSMRGV